MLWILVVLLQIFFIVSGIRKEQRAGLWSWSKFFFALAFGILEWVLIMAPVLYMNPNSSYYVPIVVTVSTAAALNFIWFIILMRRWRLPDGRTSLQAYRDEQRALQKDE